MKLSIILPSYKSGETLGRQLPPLKKWLEEKNISHEIIVVDDGSGDNGETKQAAEENGCVYILHEVNRGKGAAVRTGMLVAKGDFRIFTDADIPFEYESFGLFLHYLEDKEFDLAVGDRTLPESKYFSEIKGSRRAGSSIFTFFVGRFVTTGLFDTQCGLKGFSAKAAEDLFSVARLDGFAFDVELLYIALKRNYDIKRLPVSFRSSHDHSSVSLMRHAPGMIMDLFRIKWNQVTGRYRRTGK
ncbi:MAG TPA: glycosyltransferase [Bacteroidia bacterium]|nr:glycosyltransferase [Bacteroidia bacterium]